MVKGSTARAEAIKYSVRCNDDNVLISIEWPATCLINGYATKKTVIDLPYDQISSLSEVLEGIRSDIVDFA